MTLEIVVGIVTVVAIVALGTWLKKRKDRTKGDPTRDIYPMW